METTNKADHTGRQKQNKIKIKKQQTNKETKKKQTEDNQHVNQRNENKKENYVLMLI